jgi:hypothetical protein
MNRFYRLQLDCGRLDTVRGMSFPPLSPLGLRMQHFIIVLQSQSIMTPNTF